MGNKQSTLLEQAYIYQGQDVRKIVTNDNKIELSQIVAVNIIRLLCEHKNCPFPSFQLELPVVLGPQTTKDRLNRAVLTGNRFFDEINLISNLNKRLQENQTFQSLGSLRDTISSLAQISSKLSSLGVAFFLLSELLEESEYQKMKKYVEKVSEALGQKMDMKLLKLTLDFIRAKIVSIQIIFEDICSDLYNDKQRRALMLSLFYPCEEIYQLLRKEGGICQLFAFYCVEIATNFAIFHLTLLSIAQKEFEINLSAQIEQKAKDYKGLLFQYINAAAYQRIACFVCEYQEGWNSNGRTLKIFDKLTGEIILFPSEEELVWYPELGIKYFIEKFERNVRNLEECILNL